MRYCFLTTGSWANNTMYMRFREIGKELIARGIEVSYIAEGFPENTDQNMFLPAGAKVYRTPPANKLSGVRYRRRLLKKEIRPDFVHVLNSPIKSLAVLMGLGIPIVADWDEWIAGLPLKGISLKRRIGRFADRWYRRHAAIVLVCSRYLQNIFSKMGLQAHYIPYAVFLPPQPNAEVNPFVEPTGVFMGTLYPTFDQDLLFSALVELRDRGHHPPVRFVGRGPEFDKWKKFVEDEKLTNVRMMGYLSTEEMFQHLRHAHVLLFPIRENLTNLCRCPSKAYAFGQARRPVITNRVGEVPEVLGDKATYVEQTPQAFADAMTAAFAKAKFDDIDYGIEQHNWSARTEDLLKALSKTNGNPAL